MEGKGKVTERRKKNETEKGRLGRRNWGKREYRRKSVKRNEVEKVEDRVKGRVEEKRKKR